MQEKVTSYEISKRLDELDFKANSVECWVELYPAIEYQILDGKKEIDYSRTEHYFCDDDKHDFHLQQQHNDTRLFITDYKSDICGEFISKYQAYDCHDLLMWLMEHSKDIWYLVVHQDLFVIRECWNDSDWDKMIKDKEPQNASGLAIIKALEKK